VTLPPFREEKLRSGTRANRISSDCVAAEDPSKDLHASLVVYLKSSMSLPTYSRRSPRGKKKKKKKRKRRLDPLPLPNRAEDHQSLGGTRNPLILNIQIAIYRKNAGREKWGPARGRKFARRIKKIYIYARARACACVCVRVAWSSGGGVGNSAELLSRRVEKSAGHRAIINTLSSSLITAGNIIDNAKSFLVFKRDGRTRAEVTLGGRAMIDTAVHVMAL